MADNPLLQAMLGVNVTPQETLFGQGAQTIGTMMPNVYSPYASPGRNIASIAGAGLLAGLMGYAARREAEAENRALAPQFSAILSAQTPEELSTLAGAEGFPSRLMPLAQQMMLQRLTQQQTAAEKESEFAAERRKAAITAYGQLAAARGTTEDQEILRRMALGDGGLPPMTETVQSEGTPQTTQPKPLLSPTEERQRRTDINTASEAIVNDRLTGAFKEAESALKSARVFAERDDKVATIALKKIGERGLNPGNQVTMQELDAYRNVMPILEKYRSWFMSQATGRSDLTPKARAEIVAAIETVTDNLGAIYNERVTSKFKQLEAQGLVTDISEVAPFKIYIPQQQLKTEVNEIVNALEQNRAALSAGRKGIDEALQSQLQQRLRELRERL